jgi:hypothetical protein
MHWMALVTMSAPFNVGQNLFPITKPRYHSRQLGTWNSLVIINLTLLQTSSQCTVDRHYKLNSCGIDPWPCLYPLFCKSLYFAFLIHSYVWYFIFCCTLGVSGAWSPLTVTSRAHTVASRNPFHSPTYLHLSHSCSQTAKLRMMFSTSIRGRPPSGTVLDRKMPVMPAIPVFQLNIFEGVWCSMYVIVDSHLAAWVSRRIEHKSTIYSDQPWFVTKLLKYFS